MKFGFCPICGGCSFYCPIYRPYSWLLFSYWMWWTDSSNRSTAPWRPRLFFSSWSLPVQWSRYLFVFVSVLIFAMIQDQALVASKHLLVETEDKNLVDNAVDNFNNACTGEPMCLGNGGCRCCGAACHCSDAGCRCTKSGLKMFVPKCHILAPQTDGDYWMGKK